MTVSFKTARRCQSRDTADLATISVYQNEANISIRDLYEIVSVPWCINVTAPHICYMSIRKK